MNKFLCGLCKGNVIAKSRKGLREHLKKEHRILKDIANVKSPKGDGQRHLVKLKDRQGWWGVEQW